MKLLVRLCGLFLLWALLLSQTAAQPPAGKIIRIDIKHVGPIAVSDDLVRGNIRVKVGDPYRRLAINDDIRNLYATGLFYNIHVSEETTSDGIILTYAIQSKPRLPKSSFRATKSSAMPSCSKNSPPKWANRSTTSKSLPTPRKSKNYTRNPASPAPLSTPVSISRKAPAVAP